MKYRHATVDDASALAVLAIEVWAGTYLRTGISSFFADYALSTFSRDKMAELVGCPTETMIVSENDTGIDGFVRVSQDVCGPVSGCSTTEIATLYVRPRHHGQGIGQALLRQAMEVAQDYGAGSVWLTVNHENTSALGFYARQGFRKIGQTLFRIGDEVYPNDVLTRDLNDV